MKILLIAVLAVLAGCASPQSFSHASRTAEEFDTDKWQCHAQAVAAGAATQTGMTGVSHAIRQSQIIDEIENSCLFGKGYKRVS